MPFNRELTCKLSTKIAGVHWTQSWGHYTVPSTAVPDRL